MSHGSERSSPLVPFGMSEAPRPSVSRAREASVRLGDGAEDGAERRPQAPRAGVPVISVHSTRRTYASLLVAPDVHPRVAMAILRHSQIAVTMEIYSQVSSTSTREALKRLGSQFGEGSL